MPSKLVLLHLVIAISVQLSNAANDGEKQLINNADTTNSSSLGPSTSTLHEVTGSNPSTTVSNPSTTGDKQLPTTGHTSSSLETSTKTLHEVTGSGSTIRVSNPPTDREMQQPTTDDTNDSLGTSVRYRLDEGTDSGELNSQHNEVSYDSGDVIGASKLYLVEENVCNVMSTSKLQKARVFERINITLNFADCGNPAGEYTWTVGLMAVDNNLRAQRIDIAWIKLEALALKSNETVYTFIRNLWMEPMRFGQPVSECQKLHFFDRCFQANDGYDEYRSEELICFRRADAVLFNYVYDGEDLIGLSDIEVTIESMATKGNIILARVNRKYKHSILLPCKMVFNDRAVYQVGPGHGKFTRRQTFPEIGDLVDFEDLE